MILNIVWFMLQINREIQWMHAGMYVDCLWLAKWILLLNFIWAYCQCLWYMFDSILLIYYKLSESWIFGMYEASEPQNIFINSCGKIYFFHQWHMEQIKIIHFYIVLLRVNWKDRSYLNENVFALLELPYLFTACGILQLWSL